MRPCVVETKIQGKPVKIEVETAYPFRDEITIKVTVPEPLSFPLHQGARLGRGSHDPAIGSDIEIGGARVRATRS